VLITASKIHDGRKWLPAGSVLEVADDGTVLSVHNNVTGLDVKHYEGVLCPGFVNVHCHLELSHMKGVIPEHTGLVPFLQQVMQQRGNFTDEQRKAARHEAYNEMRNNGVVAVGDIANVTDTTDLRALGELHFHTFVETIGFTQKPQRQFDYAVDTLKSFATQHSDKKRLAQSITPHAPYSVSETLFSLIDKHEETSVISIHNQESRAEDEYYMLKQGGMQTLLHSLKIDDSFFTPSGKSSLQTYLGWLSASHPFIFVHDTYTTLNDLQVAQTLLPEVFWCFCPNANLYIESRLPDIHMFVQKDAKICIGTDSLASNHELSVVSELYTIKQHYPELEWEVLLRWGTYNGACALQMQDITGSIAAGQNPGVLQLNGLDGTGKPTVKRIV
jgi:cytosine/adenosine deaminase-related metal-dependent hydrolase